MRSTPNSTTLATEIDNTAAWLASDEAMAQITRDPYWPKWDNPWWRMLLLFELGEAERIPLVAALHLARTLDQKVLHHFPITED